ncbi:MAG TPA: hypothetical protein VLE53_05725 [Gemmatimonadaceae bacterium]|nr:hypothetical protein [Gemmatimonadaceae bacterium]
MAQRALPVLERRGFGQTLRRDAWWAPNVPIFIVFTSFVVYATWAAFQGAHYTHGPYLSPFYSPELFGDSAHAVFGPRPGWWPAWLPFSPALLILPFPGLFRFTCYYYRGAYYKAFWQDPSACAVGEPRSTYWGEQKGPLRLQNIHRYFWYIALLFLVVLGWDAWKGFWFLDPTSGDSHFGVGVGSLILVINWVLLVGYTLGCHAARHLLGGVLDQLSLAPVRKKLYDFSSGLNLFHGKWAWFSLFSVALADLYIRLCSMGVLTDLRLV